ncbi:hypothetical protein V6N13_019105 [Hibiscus sabdariffa]
MSGAADDSTTKFPISGKVPLEWLMHRSASPSPGHAQSVGVFVTPGRPTTRGFGLVDARSRWLCATCLDNVTPNTGSPCVATVQLGGVSRPSNVRASARSMSQWVYSLLGFFIVPSGCGVPSLIVSSAPRSNLSFVWVVERWVWMLLLVRNGHVSGEMVVCVGRLRASCIELSSRTPLQCPHHVAVVPKGCDRDPVTTRERVIKHQREGVWSLNCAPSPPCPGDTGTRVPVAKRTTPGVNYAKESE